MNGLVEGRLLVGALVRGIVKEHVICVTENIDRYPSILFISLSSTVAKFVDYRDRFSGPFSLRKDRSVV